MNKIKFLLSLFVLLAAVPVLQARPAVKPVKYVFLIIGDGMGKAHRIAGEEYSVKNFGRGLGINHMPYQADMTTFAVNSSITDSAASGTAIACGSKTNTWCLGLDAKGNRLESMAYVAQKAGKKVILISNKDITDATPAAFYAHNKSRGDYYSIALELVQSGFDFFGGGGILHYNNSKAPGYKGDVYDLARKAGYHVEFDPKKIMALTSGSEKYIVGIKGDRMPYAENNRSLTISDYLRKACQLFENHPRGFFVMCEGGRLDWAAHANNAATVIQEVLDLEKAYQEALAFSRRHPGETLIVVTADHETGGMDSGMDVSSYPVDYDQLFRKHVGRGHFAITLIRARDKHVDYTFENLKNDLKHHYGFSFSGQGKNALSKEEIEQLEKDFNKHVVQGRTNVDFYEFDTKLLRLQNRKAGFTWSSTGHTGKPVLTSAVGINAEMFTGTMDNSDIGKWLKQMVR